MHFNYASLHTRCTQCQSLWTIKWLSGNTYLLQMTSWAAILSTVGGQILAMTKCQHVFWVCSRFWCANPLICTKVCFKIAHRYTERLILVFVCVRLLSPSSSRLASQSRLHKCWWHSERCGNPVCLPVSAAADQVWVVFALNSSYRFPSCSPLDPPVKTLGATPV